MRSKKLDAEFDQLRKAITKIRKAGEKLLQFSLDHPQGTKIDPQKLREMRAENKWILAENKRIRAELKRLSARRQKP